MEKSTAILIQAELLKGVVANGNTAQGRIESIFDLYELYAKHQAHSKIYDRNVFEMAVICGNLTIIIDGLDELRSIFQENFEVESFLQSIKDLHEQLGNSQILLTTRNHVVADTADLERLSIKQYQLLGFDQAACKTYLRRRLHGLGDGSAQRIEHLMERIGALGITETDNRIVPFFADVVATVAADSLKFGSSEDFDLSSENTPYPSNNELTDHIVHSVFRREEKRHHLGISIPEAVDITCELATEYKQNWQFDDMKGKIEFYYDERGLEITPKFMRNHLLLVNGSDIRFRYSFLGSYFTTLFILKGIINHSSASELSYALAKIGSANDETKDIRKYFHGNKEEVSIALAKLIPSLRDRAISKTKDCSTREKESAKGAIAVLLGIFASLHKGSMEKITNEVLMLYGIARKEGKHQMIKGLALSNDFPPFDFSNLTISDSIFRNYSNFLNSKFDKGTSFIYSNFEECANSKITNTSLRKEMIESTCSPGNLDEALALAQSTDQNAKELLNTECEKFLGSFYRGDRFEDKRRDYIKFSTKIPGLANDKLDRLIGSRYIVLAKEKTIGLFYAIAPDFQASVRRFLSKGYIDASMRAFLQFVK